MEKNSIEAERRKDSSKMLTWANFEIFINNLNHGLIAITTFYLTWFCIKAGITHHFSAHTIISTIGYQVLMAEGILVLYKRNTYTFLVESREKKTTIHWVLLLVGSVMGVVGTLWEFIWRAKNGRRHFVNRHGLWGLASMFLLAPTFLAGLAALFPKPIQKYCKPLLSKVTHNVFGVASFVTGMISTIFGYTDLRWTKSFDPGNMNLTMAYCLIAVTLITLIGPARTSITQVKSFLIR